MGIFLKTQKLMNIEHNLYWQLEECKYMDGHGYVTNYAVLNGQDEFNNHIRRYYKGYKFDDTNPAVTTFDQPTARGKFRSAVSTDGVDVMASGGEDSVSTNTDTIEQFRADSGFAVAKTASPVLSVGRELGIGTASRANSHWHIGGQRATNNPQSEIEAVHYSVNATLVAQGNLTVSGRNPIGCGNGNAAFYRENTVGGFQILQVINIADHTGGTGTNFISQVKSGTSLVGISQLGSAVSTGPDAVFVANTVVTAIPFDDTGVEATWPVTLASNHNRGAATTDGDTIAFSGGLLAGSDTIRYIQADSMNTTVTASTQSLDISMKWHSMISYQ
jgi:hypothetical protein